MKLRLKRKMTQYKDIFLRKLSHKKAERDLKTFWVELDVRNKIIYFIFTEKDKTEIEIIVLIKKINLSSSKYYTWISRHWLPENHNGRISKDNWLRKFEKKLLFNMLKFYRFKLLPAYLYDDWWNHFGYKSFQLFIGL